MADLRKSKHGDLCCHISKDGDDCVLAKELVDADIVISQPFWPAYITEEWFKSAPKLKLCITSGIGSDYVDLKPSMEINEEPRYDPSH